MASRCPHHFRLSPGPAGSLLEERPDHGRRQPQHPERGGEAVAHRGPQAAFLEVAPRRNDDGIGENGDPPVAAEPAKKKRKRK